MLNVYALLLSVCESTIAEMRPKVKQPNEKHCYRGTRIIEYAPAPVSISTAFPPKTGGPCRAIFREFRGPGVKDPLYHAAKNSGGGENPCGTEFPVQFGSGKDAR